MMGMQTAPAQLFYDFCLDDHVPEHHLLRRIDLFLDLDKVRTELKPFYSETSAAPRLIPNWMIRILGLSVTAWASGHPNGGCARRSISTWPIAGFVTLGLDGRVPDHPHYPRATGMVGSGRAICCGTCSRR